MDDRLMGTIKKQLRQNRELMEGRLPNDKQATPKPSPKRSEPDMSDAGMKKRDDYYRSKGWMK